MCGNPDFVNREDEFFMVFVEGGNPPRVKHASRDQADKEALRLAKDTGRTTYVLAAICGYRVPEPCRFKCTPF